MQNPLAFEWDWRNTPQDCYNMNRTYPGNSRGWVTEQMASVVSPLCDYADALIDWHGGGYGDAIHYVLSKLGPSEDADDELLSRINHMAKTFWPCPHVRRKTCRPLTQHMPVRSVTI